MMKSVDSPNAETLTTQIVILGSGGAGMAAAVAAAQKGAEVVVLEKLRSLGGSSARAEGLLAADSPAQKRMNIHAPRDEVFNIAMSYSHWRINAKLVRAFIDKSGDTIRWLEDQGLFFDWIPTYIPDQRIRTWHCLRGRGIELIDALVASSEKLGVRILRETAAKRLLTDEKGNVTGVLAAAKGKDLVIKAKSVIIATGGYGGNRRLLKKYYPKLTRNMRCVGTPNTGDGLLMALEIGAGTEGLGLLQFCGHAPPGAPQFARIIGEEPNTVWVNKRGERFMNEAVVFNHYESINGVLQQPDSLCYTLFDDRLKKNWIEKGIYKGQGYIVAPGTKLVGLDEQLQQTVKKGNAKIAGTWDEIARWMGAEPETLRNTVEEYNTFCDKGRDALFIKDVRFLEALRTPPYYALKCHPAFLGTIGGIRINEKMEVVNTEFSPVPGVYAAGIDTGGWEIDTYNAVLSGTTFGFAVNSGRIAGENAAAYVIGTS
jgi:fumarate reductase flavoprotein subunit